MSQRFARPWKIEEFKDSFCVRDANGMGLFWVYFRDLDFVSPSHMSRDEARLLIANAQRIPELIAMAKSAQEGAADRYYVDDEDVRKPSARV